MGKVNLVRNLLMNVLVLLATGSSLSSGQTTPKKVICYHQYWSVFSPVVTYTVSDIDASLCTHVVYYYTSIDEQESTLREAYPDFNHSSVWNEFVNLRLANPSLKVILAVADYGYFLRGKSHDDRQTFINNVVEFLRRWDFDGLDHWLYAELTPSFENLLEEMHAAFAAEATSIGRDPLILSVTMRNFGDGVDVQKLAQAVDIFHVQTDYYSLGFSFEQTGLSAPLYGNWNRGMNVSQMIFSVLDAGVPPEKLHLTIQLHAVTFTLSDPVLTGVGAPAKARGNKGEYTGVYGELTYYEVCKRLQEGGYTVELDPVGLVNFAYKGNQWMSYEDPASLEIKMNYAYEHNLGGFAVWFISEDDYTGQFCNQGPYPLVSTLYNYRPDISYKTELSPQAQTPPKNVICHLNYWSLNSIEPGVTGVTNYTISDIDTSLCTHVVYFFTPIDIGKLTLYETSGYRKHSSVWKEFVNLRLANPSLKVLLSVRDYGGPDRHIENKSYEKRQTFINNVVEFLRRWDFDGFGFIYYRTFTPAAGRFIEEMHAAFAAEATSSGRDSLILMVKLHPWGKDGFVEGVDVQGLAEAVDILQIHTMQYSLGYYDTTGLSTPLYGHNRNVARTITGFLDDGMTPEKLYMTIQLYAISFTLSDPELNGVGAAAIDEGDPGEYSRRPFGELTYYEVCKLLQEGGYTTKVDPEGLVNFAYKGDQWMTYEDPASLEIKMSYVYEHNLGGVAAEYLYDDDYTGQFCNGGRYPLLSTLYNYRPANTEMP